MAGDAFADRPLPQWFDDAKLGVLIHYGPYTVPAWAERSGTMQELWSKRGPAYFLCHNPYAEWYENTMRIAGSETQRHHLETYGDGFSYDDFIPQFNEASAKADFSAWAELFERAGVRYALLTTKHHDGYLLWPSRHAPPKPHYRSPRDIVGELTEAVRARGLRMGLYYSGGYDKLFNPTVISSLRTSVSAVPQGAEYARYCDAHFDELIERYQPSVLWNDIAYPASLELNALFERYYRAVPDGVVNERWTQIGLRPGIRTATLFTAIFGLSVAWPLLPLSWRALRSRPTFHHDFTTPEYESYPEARPKKWEAVRGLGLSFGNNRTERDEDMLSVEQLVQMLADVVSKNGNLAIGIAPDPDGTFPESQRSRLLGLGEWLSVHGEAIYDTRPWDRAEGRTTDGAPVRFTRKGGDTFAIVFGPRPSGRVTIENLPVREGAQVQLLGEDQLLAWDRARDGLSFTLPQRASGPAWAVRIGYRRRQSDVPRRADEAADEDAPQA